MAVATAPDRDLQPVPKAAWFYRREVRQVFYQVLLVIIVVAIGYMIVSNTLENLRRQNIASGFGFLDRTAGFDISQTLIPYSNTSTYGRAFLAGLLNTLLVAGIGIVLATMLGFLMGIARLSRNWLIAKLAAVYVEVARNIPLLLQLFFWYFAVLKNLPAPRQSLQLPGGAYLNVRGLYAPALIWYPGVGPVLWGLVLGILLAVLLARWAHARQMRTGQPFPVLWSSILLVLGVPLLAFVALGMRLSFEFPQLRGFNFQGGLVILPELLAILAGLVVYTGAYIAETVRSGILGISKGQREAAAALGLSNMQTLRLVIIPQGLRIIIPPLTSQYLNLTKNSSLGVAIAYPELVSVFAGTVLNQTGQAVEIILVTMGVYLSISLLTSGFMNWFNRRVALVER